MAASFQINGHVPKEICYFDTAGVKHNVKKIACGDPDFVWWEWSPPPSYQWVNCEFSKTYTLSRAVGANYSAAWILTTGLLQMYDGNMGFPFFGQVDVFYQDKTVVRDGKTCYVYKCSFQNWQTGPYTTGEIQNWGTVIPSGSQFCCDTDGKLLIFDSEPV